MPNRRRTSRATRIICSVLLLAGCAPAPTHTTPREMPSAAAPQGLGQGSVVLGKTGTTPVTTAGGTPITPTFPGNPTVPSVPVQAPIVSNNGGSVIHGSVMVPPSILSNNGSNIVSPNGGTIVSPNGGTIVSPNGGTIVSPNGGTIVSPNGGTIVSPNGGTIVSPNGGTVISNNGAGFKLAQVPMRYADVKLTDAAGKAVQDSAGKDLVTKTDANGNYSFTVDVRGRNLVVRVVVPGQTEGLLGLLPKEGSDADANVDLNSTLSMSYILQHYVNGDVGRFERLDSQTFAAATKETDTALAAGTVPLPKALSSSELSRKVEQIRLASGTADKVFEDIRRLLIPLGTLNEGDGLRGLQVYFGLLTAAHLSDDGTIYAFSIQRHTLWTMGIDGIVHTIVARGNWGYEDVLPHGVPAFAVGMAVDPRGYVYLSDYASNRVVRVSPEGDVVTVAGTGEAGFGGDGQRAIDAKLNHPTGLCLASDGTLTFSDTDNHRIRRISPAGTISTLVGDDSTSETLDASVPGGVHLLDAEGIALDKEGNLYVADAGHHRVFRVLENGQIDQIANDPATFNHPINVAIQGKDLIILDNQRSYPVVIAQATDMKANWATTTTSLVGTGVLLASSSILSANDKGEILLGSDWIYKGSKGHDYVQVFGVDSQAADNVIDQGWGMTVTRDGTVYIVDRDLGRVFKQSRNSSVIAVAGKKYGNRTEETPVEYSNPLDAPLYYPESICRDPLTDEVLVTVPSSTPSIRRLKKDGRLVIDRTDFSVTISDSTGANESVQILPKSCIFLGDGTEYIAGVYQSKEGGAEGILTRVQRDGKLNLIPGTNLHSYSPMHLAFDVSGDLFFVQGDANALGVIQKVRGDDLVSVLDVHSDMHIYFEHAEPVAAVADSSGNLYVTDSDRIYRRDPISRKISIVAGKGGTYFSGDSRDTGFRKVTLLQFNDAGDLYILDMDQVKLLTASQLAVFN